MLLKRTVLLLCAGLLLILGACSGAGTTTAKTTQSPVVPPQQTLTTPAPTATTSQPAAPKGTVTIDSMVAEKIVLQTGGYYFKVTALGTVSGPVGCVFVITTNPSKTWIAERGSLFAVPLWTVMPQGEDTILKNHLVFYDSQRDAGSPESVAWTAVFDVNRYSAGSASTADFNITARVWTGRVPNGGMISPMLAQASKTVAHD